jgi:acyl dehydratase
MPRTSQPGDTFTHVRECDRYRPVYYAGASGDFNPIHIDPDAGKAAGLNGNILHGTCTLGWAVEAVGLFVGDPGRVRRVRVRFSKPVRTNETRNQDGAVVVKGTWTAIVRG